MESDRNGNERQFHFNPLKHYERDRESRRLEAKIKIMRGKERVNLFTEVKDAFVCQEVPRISVRLSDKGIMIMNKLRW